MVKKLIAAKIDVSIKDDQEDTALHLATTWGSFPIIEELVIAGANVNAKNNVGKTPLNYAFEAKVIDFLTKNGAK